MKNCYLTSLIRIVVIGIISILFLLIFNYFSEFGLLLFISYLFVLAIAICLLYSCFKISLLNFLFLITNLILFTNILFWLGCGCFSILVYYLLFDENSASGLIIPFICYLLIPIVYILYCLFKFTTLPKLYKFILTKYPQTKLGKFLTQLKSDKQKQKKFLSYVAAADIFQLLVLILIYNNSPTSYETSSPGAIMLFVLAGGGLASCYWVLFYDWNIRKVLETRGL